MQSISLKSARKQKKRSGLRTLTELEDDMKNILETPQEIGELIIRQLFEVHYRGGVLKGIQVPVKFEGEEYTITVKRSNK